MNELKQQLAGDIKKPSYRLQSESGEIYEINKTEYENALEEHQKKQSNTITMPQQEAIDEHKNLVKVLESGTEEERKAEAAKQAKELEGYEEGMDEGTPEDAPERSLKELVEERTKINEAFDKLIEAAKEELGIGVEKPKEGKRISSEVQMQKSLYNPSFFETYFRRTR